MDTVRLCEVMFAVILISACVSSTPVTQPNETAVKTTKLQQQHTKSDLGGYYPEDPYLQECYRNCKISRTVTTCLKYRALRFIHEKTSDVQNEGRSEAEVVMTLGRMNLVALPHGRSGDTYTLGLSEYKSIDSEIVKMFKFAVREVARLARTYTVTFSKKDGNDDKNPRTIGETFIDGAIGAMGSPRVLSMVLLEAFFLFEDILV